MNPRILIAIAVVCVGACGIGVSPHSSFRSTNLEYMDELEQELKRQSFSFELDDAGAIVFSRDDSEAFAKVREEFDRFHYAASLVVEHESDAAAYSALLSEHGIPFKTYETDRGTRFRYPAESFELAAQLYAEVLSQRLQRERRGRRERE
jgi:hypothetical protein